MHPVRQQPRRRVVSDVPAEVLPEVQALEVQTHDADVSDVPAEVLPEVQAVAAEASASAASQAPT